MATVGDLTKGQHMSEQRPRKLGLLAGTFEDGSFSIYAIPDPRDIALTFDQKCGRSSKPPVACSVYWY